MVGETPRTRGALWGRGPLARRLQAWQRNRADLKLFKHLAARRQLPENDQQLLTALADQHQLVRLSEIFLRPSLFASSPDPQQWSAREVTDLRRRLFDEGPQEEMAVG